MNTKELRRLANEVGCIKWTHDTRWNRETVWHLDGDEVCKCATNIGHMPEPVFAGDVAAFIAAANPAAIIELLDKFDAANAEIETANMRTDYMQAERDCANSEVADLKQEIAALKQRERDLIEKAYLIGFKSTGTKWNGESQFPGRAPDQDETWIAGRRNDLAALIGKQHDDAALSTKGAEE
jgi:hypothetical protein